MACRRPSAARYVVNRRARGTGVPERRNRSLQVRPNTIWLVGFICASLLLSQGATAAPSPKPLPADKKLAADLVKLAGEGFRTRETDHFTICYDTSFEAVRPLTGRLEGTFDAIWRFCDANRVKAKPLSARLAVLLFNRYEDFGRYSESVGVPGGSIAGFYHHENNIAAFCNTLASPGLARISRRIDRAKARLDQIKEGPAGTAPNGTTRAELQRNLTFLHARRESLAKRFNRFVIQHEAAHQMLFNMGVHVAGADNPVWLVEGLACQFEVPQPGSGKLLRGLNRMRLRDLRQALAAPPERVALTDGMLADARAAGRWVSVDELITNGHLFDQADGHVVLRYAQAWGLVFFLHREYRERFGEYLVQLQSRRPGAAVAAVNERDEFRSFFGDPDARFERKWMTYMLKLRLSGPD